MPSNKKNTVKPPKSVTRKLFIFEMVALWAALAAAITVIALPNSWRTNIISVLLAVVLLYSIYRYIVTRRNLYSMLRDIAKKLDPTSRQVIENFPIAVLVVGKDGYINWYNEKFNRNIAGRKNLCGKKVFDQFPQLRLTNDVTKEIEHGDRRYTVMSSELEINSDSYVYYFIDDTNLKNINDEYFRSKPSIMVIAIDNFEEVMENEKDSERIRINSSVESIINDFITDANGVIIRQRRDRFTAIIAEENLKKIIDEKFAVLNLSKEVKTESETYLTLSIGVGRDAKDISTSERWAKQAIDMALGRGGDQAAVKTDDNFEFFGGLSQSTERRNKVKTRIVASALKNLISSASRVLIMGHKAADLDALGACVGIAHISKALGKKTNIVLREDTSMAGALVERVAEHDALSDIFLHPSIATEYLDRNTLVIIVDTHVPYLLESEELYENATSVAVIDHHRKMINHIEDAIIFYHEPYASSACEMVTELSQYFGEECVIDRFTAEALLAGITLDTKNFVMKTGARTFDAAAYLRRRGADTVEVSRMFSNSLDAYQLKADIMANAEIYRNCAISIHEEQSDEINIIAPQAADELLKIHDVEASFVLFNSGGRVSVSARSLGKVNVQIIMESVGGGGHHNMAGAQLDNVTFTYVKNEIKELLNENFNNI